MPAHNRFRHQDYQSSPPAAPFQRITPSAYPAIGSDEFHRRMRGIGQALRDSGVNAVCLLHGTFAGTDVTGILTELGRWWPRARDVLSQWSKSLIDASTGDYGNYTEEYARLFEDAMHADGQRRVEVKLVHWSSENHHLGRADGAVRLLDQLLGDDAPEGPVLLWGHSHAGNVFALVTNLLAGDADTIERFFLAARSYYRGVFRGRIDLPHWQRVFDHLKRGNRSAESRPLDIVTFGTPIRYGWDTGGYRRLLHFVNHHPQPGMPDYLACFPPKPDDLLHARGGDYIQQFGIAGSNNLPNPLAWRAWMADRRLHRLLQPNHPRGQMLRRLRAGRRVPDEGTTLLVDYGPSSEVIARHMSGHAVYTRRDWMLFHAEEVAARFYGYRP